MTIAAREMPKEYEIVDPTVKPDMAGTLGGVVVVKRDGKMFVRMTRAQAEWYLIHKTIRAVGSAQPMQAQAAPPARGRRKQPEEPA